MAWTYSGDPAASARDEVRFLVGDTDTNDQLLQDAEIAYTLSKYPNPLMAAVRSCMALAAKFSRQADASAGPLSESSSQKAKAFFTLAGELRAQAGRLAKPVFGGVVQSENETLDQDTNAVQPSFRVGGFDHPSVSSERAGSPFTDPLIGS
jgi:hypothetical protein